MSHIEAESMLTEKCSHFSKFLKHLISYELDYFFHKLWTTNKMSLALAFVTECGKLIESNGANRAICSRASAKFSIVWGTNQSILCMKGKVTLRNLICCNDLL